MESITSSGNPTQYDPQKAATENYHSQGDSGFTPQDTSTTGVNQPDQTGSKQGGTIQHSLLFLLLVIYIGRRFNRSQSEPF